MKATEIIPSNVYMAFVIDEHSRANLLSHFEPTFSRKLAHHVTLKFSVTASDIKAVEAGVHDQLGDLASPEVVVVGYAIDDGVECVTVTFNGEYTHLDSKHYHVTLSVEPPHKPVESNLITKNATKAVRLKLTGAVKLLQK